MRSILRTMMLVVIPLLPLAACGGTDDFARSIGITRDSPDEFVVTTRAPLSMPPDFTIRPPTPGVTRPQELSPRQAAEATLAPQSTLAPAASSSPGQAALLAAAGPPAPPDIRTEVNKQTAVESGSRSLTDRLMFWKAPPPAGVAVDPERESKRLRENAALGQSQETGDTPIIQRSSSGFLGRLF